jgi:hypothetical protein
MSKTHKPGEPTFNGLTDAGYLAALMHLAQKPNKSNLHDAPVMPVAFTFFDTAKVWMLTVGDTHYQNDELREAIKAALRDHPDVADKLRNDQEVV